MVCRHRGDSTVEGGVSHARGVRGVEDVLVSHERVVRGVVVLCVSHDRAVAGGVSHDLAFLGVVLQDTSDPLDVHESCDFGLFHSEYPLLFPKLAFRTNLGLDSPV